MKTRRACTLLLVFGTFALPHLAQGGLQPLGDPSDYWGSIDFTDSNSIDWPQDLGGPGPFQRVLAGSFTDDDVTSAIVLDGGIAVLVYHPTAFTALHEVSPLSFNDIAVLPAKGGLFRDALLSVGASGLVHSIFDSATREFVSTAITSPHFENASRLLVAELDGFPDPEVLGLDATGQNFMVATLDEFLALSASSIHPVGGTALELGWMDWDHDGAQEVLVFADDKLKVFTPAGVLVDDVRVLQPGGTMSVLRDPGARDQLAWVTRNLNNTAYWLYSFHSDGYTGPLPLLFTPPGSSQSVGIDVFAVPCGDWDGDKRQDLLLGHESFLQSVVLNNLGTLGAAAFDASEANIERLDLAPMPGQSASGNRGVPSFADLDRDPFRTADVVVPLDTHQGLVVKRSLPERTTYHPVGGAPAPIWEYFHAQSYYTPGSSEEPPVGGEDGTLSLMMNDIPFWLLENFDYIQAIVWRQPDPITNPQSRTEQTSMSNFLHPIADDEGETWGYQWIDIPIPEPGSIWTDREHFYVYLRFVRAVPDPNGIDWTVTKSSYAVTLGCTLPGTYAESQHLDPNTNPAYAYLLENGYDEFLIPMFSGAPPYGDENGNIQPGNVSVGAIVPYPVIPPVEVPYIPNPQGPRAGSSSLIWFP